MLIDQDYVSPLIRLARVIRDLLAIDENDIVIGRIGTTVQDFDQPVITIDTLGVAQVLGTQKTFNSRQETEQIATTQIQAVDVNVWGHNAYRRAVELTNLLKSQQCFELSFKQNIVIKNVGVILNAGMITGVQNRERYQLSFNIVFSDEVAIPTRRIERLNFKVKKD